jgi:TatD DNase family protein
MSKKKASRTDPLSLNLPCVGVETHAHLDMADFAPDLKAVLAEARAAGVARIGNVFLGPEALEKSRGLFDAHPEVFFILGVHPHEAKDFAADTPERLRAAFAGEPRLAALGEIGLDFFWDHSPRERQAQVFRAQLLLARDLDLPVVVHSRDALEETFAILDKAGFAGRRLLWHCFGGGPKLARRILDRGWHVSIPGPVTYRRAEALREAVRIVPLERMVIETDCPYLAPEPWRGKRNRPALLAFVAAAVAEVKGLPVAEVWARCAETARAFFGL